LAHRRRRYAEIRCRCTKTAPLGDAQERFDTVERTTLDRIPLLHSASRLG